MNEPTPLQVMTLAQAAEFLQCHPSTLYRMIKRRTIPAFRLGADWRFERGALARWIEERMGKVEKQ